MLQSSDYTMLTNLVSATNGDLLAACLGGLLLGHLASDGVVLLDNLLGSLLSNELNVCGTGVEVVDTTVGTVCASVHLRGLVGVGVGDGALLDVKTLGGSVSLDVSQKTDEHLGGLLGPGNLVAGNLELLGLCVTADGTGVFGEGDGLLVQKNILQVLLSVVDGATLDGLANLTAVLVVNTDMVPTGLGHYNLKSKDRVQYVWHRIECKLCKKREKERLVYAIKEATKVVHSQVLVLAYVSKSLQTCAGGYTPLCMYH